MKAIYCAVTIVLLSMPVSAAERDLVANWTFDDIRVERKEVRMVRGETYIPKEKFGYVREEVGGEQQDLNGKYYESVPGVKGRALLLDGYTTHVAPGEDQTAYVSGDFSVEVWIALGAYPKNWGPYEITDASMTKIMLNGLTDKTVEELVPLTKSWANPPELKVVGSGFENEGYDATDLAFHLTCKNGAKPLTMKIASGKELPVVDPAFVVNNWGYAGADLQVNGKTIELDKDFRVGHRERLDGTDLVVWFRFETTEPVTIKLTPVH